MKTLRQALLDYDVSLLSAIAQRRAIEADIRSKSGLIDQLVAVLLSPADAAIVLEDLSQTEREALRFLQAAGGQVERAKFARRYGVIRPMGAARLERERPWVQPANPAEGLWYRGLIFKTFQVANDGSHEMVFVPSDLRPLLSPDNPASIMEEPPQFQVEPAAAPPHLIDSQDRLRENFFSVLVHLQTTPVRLPANGALTTKDKQHLIGRLLPPAVADFPAVAELDFLLHLGQRLDLLTVAHGRLKPQPDSTKRWLQAHPDHQMWQLQNAWRADPTWNDLWRVPGLVPQQTGWENSPLKARSKILGYLEQLGPMADGWFSIADFVAEIKRIDPDFQRPDGNYESWYIQDEQGNLLMGFSHWDDVEGALIHHLIAHVLFSLGVMRLGTVSTAQRPTHFQITEAGAKFLSGHAPAASAAAPAPFLRVDNKFQVRVPAQASLYDRFQVARFAGLDQREPNRTIYRISQASISRALKNGVTHDQITAFLTRVTNNQIPLKVIETLRAWGTRYDTARLEQAAILRLEHERLAADLQRNPQIAPLLGEKLGPATFLIPGQNVAALRKLLTELGYIAT